MGEMKRLTARSVQTASEKGYYCDGGGLYLQVTGTGAKSWLFRYRLNGRSREMGLGPTHTVTLQEARQEAEKARKMLRDGVDPIEQRKAIRAAQRLEDAKAITFQDCAERYIAAHEAAWKNEKHRWQWRSSLASYAYPTIGDLPVAGVDTGLVMRVLEPIWTTKTETASRLRGRIEAVLDWAKVRGYRDGENPARWKGHLQALLPAKGKVGRRGHHEALPYDHVPAFLEELRAVGSISAKALEFLILTAARTTEVLNATWTEVDFDRAIWTVPAERMKGGKEHRVPLPARAVDILEELRAVRRGAFLFPGQKPGKPQSNMSLLMLLRRMDRGDLTAHGFRSSFRDWAAERTHFPAEVCEQALAHAISSKVEAAYRRGDLFEKRRKLMEAWAAFATAKPADVVTLRTG